MAAVTFKRIMATLWLAILSAGIYYYLRHTTLFNQQNIATFVSQYEKWMLLCYFVICVARAFVFIPSTPFLFAGIILFPKSPLLIFGAFMLSIFVVSSLLFYASGYLNLAAYFETKYPKKIARLRERLNSGVAAWLIMIWAFLPFTPTDLVCYVAGSIKMRYSRFIIPTLAGEALISYLYIFQVHGLIHFII